MMLEKFPAGQFKQGDRVMLNEPQKHVQAFDDPTVEMEVMSVNYFRFYTPPTYVVGEPGGVGTTPFTDADLTLVTASAEAA